MHSINVTRTGLVHLHSIMNFYTLYSKLLFICFYNSNMSLILVVSLWYMTATTDWIGQGLLFFRHSYLHGMIGMSGFFGVMLTVVLLFYILFTKLPRGYGGVKKWNENTIIFIDEGANRTSLSVEFSRFQVNSRGILMLRHIMEGGVGHRCNSWNHRHERTRRFLKDWEGKHVGNFNKRPLMSDNVGKCGC